MTTRRNRLATVGVLACLALSPAASAVAAPAAHGPGGGGGTHTSGHHAHAVHAGGVVTAVDLSAGTLVLAPGGHRHASVTLVVPATARIQKDDSPATLSDVAVGDHVSARASADGGVLTAVRVQVSSPDGDEDGD